MSYHPETVNLAGYSVLGVTTLASGLVAVADIPASISATAGGNAITVAVLTIATILVNGIVADRKSRREMAAQVANAAEVTDRKVADAIAGVRADADHRIAILEAELAVARQAEKVNADARHAKMDQLYTMMTGLFVHATEAGHAINVLIPAVQENSARSGTPIPAVEPIEPIVVTNRTPNRN